jgi:hypothetical protein
VGPLNANYDYLAEVQNSITPNQVKYLEKVVADWEATKSPKFDGSLEQSFEVTFKSNLGYIATSYDNQGRILMAEERFKNISLPYGVGISIAKKYPDWSIGKTRYTLRYTRGSAPKKRFNVQISNGNLKKWLKIDASGKLS